MDPKFTYSNLAGDEGFLWAITAFGGGSKAVGLMSYDLQHVKEYCEDKRDTS
jgi:hypothetical protein